MRIVIIGGGPGGYEAALVAAQLGAEVTIIEDNGLGGACVLTDCVPSKTLIATSSLMSSLEGTKDLGIRFNGISSAAGGPEHARADAPADLLAHSRACPGPVRRCRRPACGRGRRGDLRHRAGSSARPSVAVGDRELQADTVLIATGARPASLTTRYPMASAC